MSHPQRKSRRAFAVSADFIDIGRAHRESNPRPFEQFAAAR
jgi:hypothetical protein